MLLRLSYVIKKLIDLVNCLNDFDIHHTLNVKYFILVYHGFHTGLIIIILDYLQMK